MYRTSEAARLAGCSAAAIRAYCKRYFDYLSPTARPTPGGDRQFNEEDVRLFAFIASQTALGITHEEVSTRLAAGEHMTFIVAREEPPPPTAAEQTALSVLVMQVQAAAQREQGLYAQIATLSQQLGEARGELTALKEQAATAATAARLPWYRRLFGL